MAPYRERADGAVEIHAHRVKSLLLVVGLAVFAVVGAIMVAVDPSEWAGWASLFFFGGLGSVFVARSLRTGVLTGKPALVLDPEGLHDRASGFRVRWDEVRKIDYREVYTRGGAQRFLGLWVHDPETVRGRLPRLARFVGRLQMEGWPPFTIPINLLGTTTDETFGLVHRFFDGEIDYEGELDPTPERPPRARRFLRWARETAIALAIGIPIAAFVIWLDS